MYIELKAAAANSNSAATATSLVPLRALGKASTSPATNPGTVYLYTRRVVSVWQGSTTAAKVDGTFGPCVSAMRHACREETPHAVGCLSVRRGAIKYLPSSE